MLSTKIKMKNYLLRLSFSLFNYFLTKKLYLFRYLVGKFKIFIIIQYDYLDVMIQIYLIHCYIYLIFYLSYFYNLFRIEIRINCRLSLFSFFNIIFLQCYFLSVLNAILNKFKQLDREKSIVSKMLVNKHL